MEKEEYQVTITENQLEFDFSDLERSGSEEEKSSILPEGFVINKDNGFVDEEVLFIIVKVKGEVDYNTELCGKKMIDWVARAGANCERIDVDDPGENVLGLVKRVSTQKKYIAIFYSDTPLFEKKHFHKIMNFFTKNAMNVLTLSRGYVFRADYVKNIESLYSSQIHDFDEGLVRVDDTKTFLKVSKFLYDKIRAYHLKNGVLLYGENSIFIDADVEIEAGVSIYQNNILRGQTYIGKGAILEANNIIIDSIISENALVVSSYIEKSKVGQGESVGPFEKLVNSEK